MDKHEQKQGQSSSNRVPTIIAIANDLTLLKLLDMALKMELACEVLCFISNRSAEETIKWVKPDLFILDAQLADHDACALSWDLHRRADLSHVPTLFLNMTASLHNACHVYPALFLGTFWQIETLYTAVRELLGHDSNSQ